MALSNYPKKGSRKTNFMNKILKGDKPTQAASFLKRNPTLKKKALELQTLCDISVFIVCFGPDGGVEVWPENEEQVRGAVMSYRGLEFKQKRETNLFNFLEAKKLKLVKKKKQVMEKFLGGVFESLSKHVDGLYGQNLIDFVNCFEKNLMGLKQKLESLELAVVTQSDVKFDVDQQNNIQLPTDSAAPAAALLWNYYHPTTSTILGSSSSFDTTNTNHLLTGSSNSNAANGREFFWGRNTKADGPMDRIYKHIVMNKNVPLPLNNYINSENHITGNIHQFNNNNVHIGNTSNSSSIGVSEVQNRGPNGAQGNYGIIENFNETMFWWDNEMVQF